MLNPGEMTMMLMGGKADWCEKSQKDGQIWWGPENLAGMLIHSMKTLWQQSAERNG